MRPFFNKKWQVNYEYVFKPFVRKRFEEGCKVVEGAGGADAKRPIRQRKSWKPRLDWRRLCSKVAGCGDAGKD